MKEVKEVLSTEKMLSKAGLSKVQEVLGSLKDHQGKVKRKSDTPTKPTRHSKRGKIEAKASSPPPMETAEARTEGKESTIVPPN